MTLKGYSDLQLADELRRRGILNCRSITSKIDANIMEQVQDAASFMEKRKQQLASDFGWLLLRSGALTVTSGRSHDGDYDVLQLSVEVLDAEAAE